MAKVPLGLRLDPVLIAAIDRARGDMSRTKWIEVAIAARLGVLKRTAPAGIDELERAILAAEAANPLPALAILRAALDRAKVKV